MATERLFPQSPGDDSDGFEVKYRSASHSASTQSLSKEFRPTKQTARLAKEQGWRVLLTFAFVAGVLVTLNSYEKDGIISHGYKNTFNSIVTGLTLALGLNFFDALKDMARTLRWRILAERPFTVGETDLILGSDNLPKVGELMLESFRKPGLFILDLAEHRRSKWCSGSYVVDGMVQTPRLDCYYTGSKCPKSVETLSNIAHSYGVQVRSDIATNHACEYSTDEDVVKANQLCQYFKREESGQASQEFAYRFSDYNPGDNTTAYPYLTSRTIKVKVGTCSQFDRDPGDIPTVNTTDGIAASWVYKFHNETYRSHINVPRPYAGFDSTTYIYNGTSRPQNETEQACGDSNRCLWMYALRTGGPILKRSEQIFACPITVGQVTNPTHPVHYVTDDVARLAIAAIALNGRYTSPKPELHDWHSYQLYPQDSDWEIGNMSPQDVGSRMAEFTIGSIATMAPRNDRISVLGKLPILGYHLSIHWRYTIALMAVIAGNHALLFVLMLWLARPIIVVEDSNLCTANVLQDLVDRFDGGKVLNGKEIEKAIQLRASAGNGRVVYGIDRSGRPGQPPILGFAEHNQIRRRLPGGAFPRGVYA